MVKRIKYFRFLLLIGILLAAVFLPSGTVQADNGHYTDRQQLQDELYRRGSSGEFSFSADAGLYNFLKNDNFFELYHLLIHAGLNTDGVQISYNDLRHYISLSGLFRTGLPWAECTSEEDVRQAFAEFGSNTGGFVILCPKAYVPVLIGGTAVNRIAALYGIERFSCSYSTETGIIRIADILPFGQPYTTAETVPEFSDAISGFAHRGISDFFIIFSPELFSIFTGDSRERTVLLGSSMLTNYQSTADLNSYAVHFTAAEFTDVPREICESITDIPDAIRRMGAAGIRNFELIFPDTSVFTELAEDHFALLQELEANAGMSSGNISYSSGSDRIIITDAEITTDAVILETTAQAIAYTEAHTAAGLSEIHLFCTPELYRHLLGELLTDPDSHDGMVRINDLLTHAGIRDYRFRYSNAAHVISVYINQLFPGTAIVRAIRNGDTGKLTARELETMAAASEIAKLVQDPDPLLTAKNIHDWICAHNEYVNDDSTDEDDNAVGAILNGKANCDGYADAFYLLGTLAGLHVRYQHGDSFEKDLAQNRETETHIWNLLEIGSVWHMVDVTWDDEEDGWSYVWFNAGQDIAGRLHLWNEDMTVAIAPVSDRNIETSADFYIKNTQDLYASIDQAQQRRLGSFHILFEDLSLARLCEEAIESVVRRSVSTVTYSWNEKAGLLTFHNISWQ